MAVEFARVREILVSGDLSMLIGEFESLQLECKRQPYQLKFDGQKLELAKDVTALANAEGGVILIGYSTVRDPAHGEDRIDGCRPIRKELLDPMQYSQTIQDWIWPPLPNLEVTWFPSSSQPEEGIWAVLVPKAADADRPVLVAKTVVDSDRRVEILFGYCQREQSRVVHYSVQRLQSLLRDGSRLDHEIRVGLQSLHASLETFRATRAPESPPFRDPEELSQRLEEAAKCVGLAGMPTYSLAANPRRPIELHQLFESRSARLVQLLEQPPELRSSGFDITSGASSRIVEGRLRRTSIEEFKLLELHRDGTLIFVARGDKDGLRWGGKNRQSLLLINQLFLIETTLLFCKLAYEVYDGELRDGDEIDFHLHLQHLTTSTEFVSLELGPLEDWFPPLRGYQQAPEASKAFRITVLFGQEPAARTAFRLVAQVYNWFGYDGETIPYSEDGRVISEDLLRNG